MSGQLQNYDFNYDEAYANVIKDFAKDMMHSQACSVL